MKRLAFACLCASFIAACGSKTPPPAPAPAPAPVVEPELVDPPSTVKTGAIAEAPRPPETPLADPHRETAEKILQAALASDAAWKKLQHLTDRIGHRLSGSKALERAVVWAQDAMKADGHENVRAEKVMVPRWIRGAESAAIVAPVEKDMRILALGNSAATPKKGLTAEVVVVSDFAELDGLGEAGVKGKLVLFNKAMPPYTREGGTRYGEISEYRMRGPARAAKLGAAGVLVRSVTARSLNTPHTGSTFFPEGVKPIPAAAITVEDAELLARLAAAGDRPRVKLLLSAKMDGEAESANVVAELRGREKPEEIIVLGAHLDSWDVGQGAHDDGAGCVIMMQALTVLRELGLQPRRTIRVVLYTNEENGIRGALAYPQQHKDELANHVAAIESDSGSFAPVGFSVTGSDKTLAQMRDLASLLAPLNATSIEKGFGGVDIMTLIPAGVPQLGLRVEASRYFDYHHTEADTLDKVDPDELRQNVAAIAIIAYAIAEMEERLDLIPEGERKLPF